MKSIIACAMAAGFLLFGTGCDDSKDSGKRSILGLLFTESEKDTSSSSGGQPADTDIDSVTADSAAEVTKLIAYPGNLKVDINWTDPDADTLDHIEITWEPNGSTVQKVAKGEEKYSAAGLTVGTRYTFLVKAVYGNGSRSEGTSIASTPSGTTSPGEIRNVKLSMEGTGIALVWEDPSDSSFDHVEITINGDPSTTQTVPKTIQSYMLGNVTGPITVTVKAVYTSGTLSTGTNIVLSSASLNTLTAPKIRVAAGKCHTLILKDGNLYGMGCNNYGQLGDGTTQNVSKPKLIKTGVQSMSAGPDFSLFIDSRGCVCSMGRNNLSQLGFNGDGSNQTTPLCLFPFTTSTSPKATAVSAGFTYSLVVLSDGTLWGSGDNSSAQQGSSNTGSSGGIATQVRGPIWKQLMSGVRDAAAAFNYNLIIKTDNTLVGMGSNANGQLGLGAVQSAASSVSVSTNVNKVAARWYHSMFIKKDGSLWGMGDNTYGQMGDGTNAGSVAPKMIAQGVSDVSVGKEYTLFLKSSDLWFTGRNTYFQLTASGFPSTTAVSYITTTNKPIKIKSGVIGMTAGDFFSIFVQSDGTIWGVGNNSSGQLGDGTTTNRGKPVPITLPSSTGASLSAVSGRRAFIIIAVGACVLAIGAIVAVTMVRRRKSSI